MSWALRQLRALWWSRWTRRVALAFVIVGLSIWVWQRAMYYAGLFQDARVFFVEQTLAWLLMITAIFAVLLLWLLPKWQARRLAVSRERRFELENEARKTVAQIIGGAVFLAGLYFTAQTLRTGQETLRVNQEGQTTERFTKAIEQLGSKELQVRLGGIYALERIARDFERDHDGPIMEVLTAYVRENAPFKKQTKPEVEASAAPVKAVDKQKRPATDIQAILTVIGRRTPSLGKEKQHRLNLQETDLEGADLVGANLKSVLLSRANLQGAILFGVNLQAATLIEADLQRAHASRANLQQARLDGANLQAANLFEANLRGAHLVKANLQRATLLGAQLQAAQLADADLREASLGGAHLQAADLGGANLRGALFTRANLQRATLGVADLQGTDLVDADLQEAVFYGTNMRGASLERTNVTQQQIDLMITDARTRCPQGLKCGK